MIVPSNAAVIRVLEEQANALTVEIDQAKQRLREIRNELSRYGQIEDLTQRDREVTNGLADCLQKIDNTKDGIAKTKETETQYPGKHGDEHYHLDAILAQEERNQQDAQCLGNLR